MVSVYVERSIVCGFGTVWYSGFRLSVSIRSSRIFALLYPCLKIYHAIIIFYAWSADLRQQSGPLFGKASFVVYCILVYTRT